MSIVIILLEWAAFGGSMLCSILYGNGGKKGPILGLFVAVLFIVFGLAAGIYAAAFSNIFFFIIHFRNLRKTHMENPETLATNQLVAPENEDFTAKARALASERIIAQKPFSWFEGSAKGSLTGSLRYVDGISGQQTFAIVPSVGANRIVCNYEEKLEAVLRDNLFKRVRIYGTLKYGSDSPHPHSVDVEKIEPMTGQERRSSQDLRGLFSDLEMPSGKIAGLLHG